MCREPQGPRVRPDVLDPEVGVRVVRTRRPGRGRSGAAGARGGRGRAVGYLERDAVWSRRGRNGVDAVPGDGLIGAAFRHRTSRAGDPHLHTHVLVANTVRGPDGQWRTLDFRHVFAHGKTAGYLYEAHLRHLLTERLGVEWRPVRNGTAELAGIPDDVRRRFSTRRAEVEAALEARGERSARAAQIATLETRRPKERDVEAGHLRARWAEAASAIGFDPKELDQLLDRRKPEPHDRGPSIPGRATPGRSTGAHRARVDVRPRRRAAGMVRPAPPGGSINEIERLADRFLAEHHDVVPLHDVGTASLRGADGRVLSTVSTAAAGPRPNCWSSSTVSSPTPPRVTEQR